jgi:hypothetical protein
MIKLASQIGASFTFRRLTLMEQLSRSPVFEGRSLALMHHGQRNYGRRAQDILPNLPELLTRKDVQVRFYTPAGIVLSADKLIGKKPEEIDAMASRIDTESYPTLIEPPDMVNISDSLAIMREEVSVRLFVDVMRTHDFEGYGAEELFYGLINAREDSPATYVSINDAREFAKRLSTLTKRNFRVPTANEWQEGRCGKDSTGTDLLLSGDHWNLTETGVLCHISRDIGERLEQSPWYRHDEYSIRLVEDKKR